jgi:predicted MFS family arabinose efflux permease
MSSPATREHRRAVLLLSLAAFASAASARLCDPMLPELGRSFSASPSQVANVVSGFAIAYGLLQVFFGPLGDRIGKYRLIAFTTLACTAGSLVAALASSLNVLVVARVLTGATAAGIIPLSMAWIGDTVPYEERQQTLARFLGGQILGVVGGQFIGGFFADTLGWRWAFGFLCIIYLLIGLAVLREARRNLAAEHRSGVHSGTFPQLMTVLGKSWARWILLIVFLEGMVIFGTLAFVPSYLHERFDLKLSSAGALMGLFGIGGLAYITFAKRLVKHLGEFGLAIGGGVFGSLAWLLFAFGDAWAWALPGSACAGLGYYMLHNTLQTNATQMAPEVRGTAVSLFASAFFIGQSVGVMIAAKMIEGAGNFSLFVVTAAALAIIATLFAALIRRKQSRQPN